MAFNSIAEKKHTKPTFVKGASPAAEKVWERKNVKQIKLHIRILDIILSRDILL